MDNLSVLLLCFLDFSRKKKYFHCYVSLREGISFVFWDSLEPHWLQKPCWENHTIVPSLEKHIFNSIIGLSCFFHHLPWHKKSTTVSVSIPSKFLCCANAMFRTPNYNCFALRRLGRQKLHRWRWSEFRCLWRDQIKHMHVKLAVGKYVSWYMVLSWICELQHLNGI